MNHDFQQLTEDWKRRITVNQNAHYSVAERLNKYHYIIGVPATILAAIAGATLLTEANEPWIKIIVGIIGLIAAVLSAVQTFYSHAKRSETHRATAVQLGQIRRDIEIFQQIMPRSLAEQVSAIQKLNERISKIDENAPVLSTTDMIDLDGVHEQRLQAERPHQPHLPQ